MKKHIKVRNNQSGEIVEVIVKDFSGRTIDRYKFNGNNGNFYGTTIESLYIKFNFRPVINNKNSIIFSNKTPTSLFDY